MSISHEYVLLADSTFGQICVLMCLPTSQFAYRKDAKAKLNYTSVADRPDIRKATQAAKLVSEVSHVHHGCPPGPVAFTIRLANIGVVACLSMFALSQFGQTSL